MVITDVLRICLIVVDKIACSVFMVAVKLAVCAQNSSFSFGCVKLLSASTINEKISSPPGLDESSLVLLWFNVLMMWSPVVGKLEIEGKNDHLQNHSDKLHGLINCWNKKQFLWNWVVLPLRHCYIINFCKSNMRLIGSHLYFSWSCHGTFSTSPRFSNAKPSARKLLGHLLVNQGTRANSLF